MFCIYILKSVKNEWYYTGHSSNVDERLKQHNEGRNKSTKAYRPFELIYTESFSTRGEAFKREQQIKKYRHGQAFKKLIGA